MNAPFTCSFSSSDSACSLEGTGSQIVPLLVCKLDMNSHLLSLGVSSGQQRSEDEKINEVDLILNRAGQFVATDDEKISTTICPRHRKKLITDWAGRKSNTCSYTSRAAEKHDETATRKRYPIRRNISNSPCHSYHRLRLVQIPPPIILRVDC